MRSGHRFRPFIYRHTSILKDLSEQLESARVPFPITHPEPSLRATVLSPSRVSPTVSRPLGHRSRLTRRERQLQEVMKLPSLAVEAGQESVLQVAGCFRYAILCHIFKKGKTSKLVWPTLKNVGKKSKSPHILA